MPPTPRKHRVAISPSYIAELRARVESVGVNAVAQAAGLVRQTLWRQLTAGSGRNPNPDGIERIRRALAAVAPDEAMPPPLVEVRGRSHHAWILVADLLDAAVLDRVAEDPAAVAALVKRGMKRK
jgi:hypothetical protein